MRLWVVLLVGCGEPAHHPDAAGAPDLALVPSQMTGTTIVTNMDFATDACELVEACIGAPGTRRLLHFATVVTNSGTADLVLGPVPAAGVSDGIYQWSPCHMHHH